jgi:hypothetical protein
MESLQETLEKKAKRTEGCVEALAARDPGMVEAKLKAGKLPRILAATTPWYGPCQRQTFPLGRTEPHVQDEYQVVNSVF